MAQKRIQKEFKGDLAPYLDAATIFKALGHPLRLKLITALDSKRCAVKEICQLLELDQSVVSQQLTVMKNLRIIAGQRRGVFMEYEIIHPLARRVIKIVNSQG